jgi:mannose/fructose/N-acetylgalactosamine-specific phosphotransferase system component IIC
VNIRGQELIQCPQCNGQGITPMSRYLASFSLPARCHRCARYSTARGALPVVLGALVGLVLGVALATGIIYQSRLPYLILGVVVIILGAIFLKVTQIKPMTDVEVTSTKQTMLVLGPLFFLVLAWGIWNAR